MSGPDSRREAEKDRETITKEEGCREEKRRTCGNRDAKTRKFRDAGNGEERWIENERGQAGGG